jgi:AcrR family transcriptional regulator
LRDADEEKAMKKKAYHHGMLKEDMIATGLRLLNKEGYEAFSLRKVAALCHVSHAAPYKHFKSKEELLVAIRSEVFAKFKGALVEAAARYRDDPKKHLINLSKCYVKFMVDNPDYFKFVSSFRQYFEPLITLDHQLQLHYQDNNEGVFEIFAKSAYDYLLSSNARAKNSMTEILALWSVVHGLTMLIANKSIAYAGDYLELVETILDEKLLTREGK